MPRLPLVVAAALALTPVAALAGAQPRPVEARVVETGAAPCGTAVRAGSLWVGVYEGGTLLRLDRRGRVETRVRVGSWACRVAVGRAAVWVTRDRAGELVRVSLGSGRRLHVKVGPGTFDVLLADGSVWATSFDVGTVARLDPTNGALERVYRDGASPTGLAVCGGLVWVGRGRAVTWVTSIDPTTHRVRRVSVGAAAPRSPHCIRGILWVATPDSVLRLDPRTGQVLSRLRLGETLAEVAEGPDGLVWVTDKQHSLVYRLDPGGRSVVDSFPSGPGAYALAQLDGSMWVTSFAGSDIRRYDP